MSGEKIFEIEGNNPVEFFGVNNANMKLVEDAFPELRIVVRGMEIKVAGTEEQLQGIENIIGYLKKVYERFGVVKTSDVKQILNSTDDENRHYVEAEQDNKVLVHGRNGRLIKARTKNQKRMVESLQHNDMLFAIGPAGTGKTYTAVALAVRALKNKEVRRIILTRPAVEAGESLGFLPGDLRDKLDPYLQPLYDALRDMLPQGKLISYFEDGTIEIAPLAFMRGRTLDHAFVILDEAQNTTSSQLKMFLTRMGKDAKFIITGDITQVDLPKNQHSGLMKAEKILSGIKGIDFIKLDQSDVVRHKLVTRIIRAYGEE